MNPKSGIVPPGGFHFIEKHGAVDRRIDGVSYTDVAEQLLRYRISNKLPVGQPLDEVNAYVCSNWPHFCSATGVATPMPRSTKPSFTIGVLEWVKNLVQRQGSAPKPLASQTVADNRAAVCRECPFQRDWADYGCGSCVDAVRKQSFVFRAGREPNHKVTGCSILWQDNNAAAFADASVLPPADDEQKAKLPANCWRKRLESPAR